MKKLLLSTVAIISLCSHALAADKNDWDAYYPHATITAGDAMLLERGAVGYYYTPSDLTTYINANLSAVVNATFATGGALRTGTTATNTFLLAAYDTDTGPGYQTFCTLTAGTSPSMSCTGLTLVTPALGTPASGVMTNVTGTASGLTAGAATALAANGANCTSGTYPLGVDASGAVETCTGTVNVATLASTSTIADAASDTTTFPVLSGDATGSKALLTDGGLSYNASTDTLSVTNLSVTTGISGGSVSTTEFGYLDGVTSAIQTQMDLKAAKAQTFQWSGHIESPSNKTYYISQKTSYAGTITDVTTKADSGTGTWTCSIDGTPLGGTANSVSSSEQSQTQSSSNAFSAGQDITCAITSNSSLAEMRWRIEYTRTLAQ